MRFSCQSLLAREDSSPFWVVTGSFLGVLSIVAYFSFLQTSLFGGTGCPSHPYGYPSILELSLVMGQFASSLSFACGLGPFPCKTDLPIWYGDYCAFFFGCTGLPVPFLCFTIEGWFSLSLNVTHSAGLLSQPYGYSSLLSSLLA